jgi:hypothetical protein
MFFRMKSRNQSPTPLNFMERSDMKRTDSNENASSSASEQQKRPGNNEERHLGYEADDQNDIPPGADDVVAGHGVDSDGDNDDEINNDVTSPNNPGAENDRVSNDGMPPLPRG